MQKFAEIRKLAESRHGRGVIAKAIAEAKPKTAAELAKVPDDRFLSMATRCIFQSGFNWKVIENKWPGFEEAFEGFDLGRWSLASDDDIARLLSDKRVVRNGAKLSTVPENARYFAGKSREHGGVGKWLANWPAEDHVGLLAELDANASRLGAATGQYFLRFIGKDSFILSRDVTAALVRAGVIEKAATSKKALAAVQQAFNQWREESGLSLTAISRVLARSIDG
jgi:3-methyladenine DNA glycosylase Tag